MGPLIWHSIENFSVRDVGKWKNKAELRLYAFLPSCLQISVLKRLGYGIIYELARINYIAAQPLKPDDAIITNIYL